MKLVKSFLTKKVNQTFPPAGKGRGRSGPRAAGPRVGGQGPAGPDPKARSGRTGASAGHAATELLQDPGHGDGLENAVEDAAHGFVLSITRRAWRRSGDDNARRRERLTRAAPGTTPSRASGPVQVGRGTMGTMGQRLTRLAALLPVRLPTRATLAASLAALLLGLGAVAHAEGENEAVTDALIWVGASERVARSRLDEGDREAIAAFEARAALVADGVLQPSERAVLLRAAEVVRRREGYAVLTDAGTGVRLGLPREWLAPPVRRSDATRWASPDGAIEIEAFRMPASRRNALLREETGGDRRVTYEDGGASWFVLSGTEAGGERIFYARAEAKGPELRGFRVSYERALSSRLDRVVTAMSSDFSPFPGQGPRPDPLDDPRLGDDIPDLPRVGRNGSVRVFEEPDEPEPPRRFALLPDQGPTPTRRPRRRTIPTLDGDVSVSTPRDAGTRGRGGPAEPDTVTVTGMVTEEGHDCPTLRGPDGTLYALVGRVPRMEPGTMVRIGGARLTDDRCSGGRPIAVGSFRVLSPG